MTIYNLGSINIDHVYQLGALPRPGETLASQSYSVGLGGKGANQSVAAARAGADVIHLGAMGTDDAWVIARLQDAGVQTKHIAQLQDEVTGHAIILVDQSGENSIILHPGANRALPSDQMAKALSGISKNDILLMQNETSYQVQAAKAAQSAGARVIYSAAPFDLAALQKVLPHIDIIALNQHEAEALFDGIQGDLPVQGLLITLGADGAEYRDLARDQVTKQAAFPASAIDTTGAGDCFAGWFAACLNEGADIPKALRHAAAAAALQVTRSGAGDVMPTKAEVEAFLDQAP